MDSLFVFDTIAPDNVSAETLSNDLGYILRVPAGRLRGGGATERRGLSAPAFVRELPIRDPLQSQTFVLEDTELRQVNGTVLFVDGVLRRGW